MNGTQFFRYLLALILAVTLAGCGGSTSVVTNPSQANRTGTVAVIGTDAPMGSVLAFQVNVTGLTASDGTNTANLFSGSQTIEFSRLNGLRTLLDLQTVPVGTYTSVTATLASPVISYLDATASPPAVNTLNGTLTQSSVTVLLNQPLVVGDGDLIGLLVDFRLRDSLEVDASGQLTGRVIPVLGIRAIPPDAPDAEIDELRGGVTSINLAGNSFVMQGPHGRSLTVVTDNQTQFEPGEGLDQLDTNSIVQVSGSLQRASLTLRATEVIILSKERFLLGGLLTDVRPPDGRADHVDLLVRTELPDLPNAQPGRITTLDFDGNEGFFIRHLRTPLSIFLFNRDSLIPGQRISAGGLLDTSTNPARLDVRRVWLHQQGLEGAWVPGSTDRANGNFLLNTGGLAGQLLDGPVKVHVSPLTRFRGLNGLADLSGTSPIRLRVVGLVVKDRANGKAVILARVVEKL